MKNLNEPTDELELEQYEEYAKQKVASILEAIIEGHRRMMNDLNVLSGIGDNVMNPPTAWAVHIQMRLERYVDGVRAEYQNSNNDIALYILSFKLRTNGNRSTVLFSFTADLPR